MPNNPIKQQLDEQRYYYIENLFDTRALDIISDHFEKSIENGVRDPQCPLSVSFPYDPLCETLSAHIAPKLSDMLGITLKPSYSYARLYFKGENLPPHVDRPACEYSITATVNSYCDHVWPIWFRTNDGPKSFSIKRGDAVLYKGEDIEHWREQCKVQWQMQFFLHFVDIDGKNKDHIHDQLVIDRDNVHIDSVFDLRLKEIDNV